MNRRYQMIFGVLALSILLFSGCTGGVGKSAESSSVLETADEAHTEAEPSAGGIGGITFEGTDLDGNAVSSAVFSRSKLTMINVWATYCGPCLSEMPALGELAAEYEPEKFQIIGIVSDVLEGDDPASAENLIQKTGADYTHLLLNESIYRALLTDVTAVPTTFFVDEDGAVLDTVIGAMDKSAWEEKIDGFLEER